MSKKAVFLENKAASGYSYTPGWLLLDNRISDGAKVTWTVGYKLARNKKSEYPRAYVSLKSLAKLRGYENIRTIQRHMEELKKYAGVTVQQRFNKPNVITFHMK